MRLYHNVSIFLPGNSQAYYRKVIFLEFYSILSFIGLTPGLDLFVLVLFFFSYSQHEGKIELQEIEMWSQSERNFVFKNI